MSAYKLLIDGALVQGAASMDVINPATEDVLAVCPRADEGQLNAAVAAAKAAFPAWSRTPMAARREALHALADKLADHREELARLLTQEQGKPLPAAHREVENATRTLRHFAGRDLPEKVLRNTPEERVIQIRRPLGVVAAITPWNVPLGLLIIKLAPALLAGNTLVAKPAPTTPLTTLRFGAMCAEILPPGAVNIITDQNDLGAALTRHPDIAKIAFTGSTATGKHVMANAASTIKRLTLELGGNDPAIVLDDVDIPAVAPHLFAGAMINSGQVCLALKRLYVPEALYDDVCDALVHAAGRAVVDDGLKQGTTMGPLQNKAQFERVKELIADARREGTIIAGGDIPERPGYFIPPTIVRDIADESRLVREEQFGPVLPVLSYKGVEEAIARANDTSYGLGATVWTGDPARGGAVARRIDAGIVWVNTHMDLGPDIAFGGAKESGIGVEYGQEGLEEYTQRHVINMAL